MTGIKDCFYFYKYKRKNFNNCLITFILQIWLIQIHEFENCFRK